MERFFPVFLLALATSIANPADVSRRLFDFTPVSSANPVVATIDGTIEIPLSELRGYRDAERRRAITDPTDLAQKRAVLDELIDEYLAIDDAYRTGVPALPAFARQMQATRTLLLTDFMAARAAAASKTAPGPDVGSDSGARATADLADRLFAATDIDVSNEAFAVLKRGAAAIDAARALAHRGPVIDSPAQENAKLRGIVGATSDPVLARYLDQAISVRQVLVIYAGMPAPRPDLQTEQGVVAMIKPMITPDLLAREAAREGVEGDPAFQHKLVQNRNTLLRFHMQGALDHEANAVLHRPALEKELHAWYEAHRPDYAVRAPDGTSRIPGYDEVAARVLGDYSVGLVERFKAERAQRLRSEHAVVVNERALTAL